jgi:hypothetical protein
LERCQLIVGHNRELSDRFDAMPLRPDAGLLFPGDDARPLTELEPNERPGQLIIPDGTWHQVKTLMRDVPRLKTLPRYRLTPESPGQYRIRREPDPHSLSTLEATVAALKSIEPETSGLDEIVDLFLRMINDQLRHGTENWRHNQRRRTGMPNVPRALTSDQSQIVVAYGEQERGRNRPGNAAPESHSGLIYWTAIRLVSGERFQCAIESESFRDEDFVNLLGLPRHQIRTAVCEKTFCERWKSFLRPQDQLAVYHPSTARLIDSVHSHGNGTLILKSINVKPPGGSITQLPAVPDLFVSLNEGSRGAKRLATAVAFVEYLKTRYDQRVPRAS